MIITAPARVRDAMVPTIYSAGPTPTNLAVSAYRPAESGYAAMVPDTWFTQHWDPPNAPFHRLRTYNTGWESGAYSSQGNLFVESGGDAAPDWCCSWWNYWCDPADCAAENAQAAIDAAVQSGGGVVFGKDVEGNVTEPIAVVEVKEHALGKRVQVTGRRDKGFEEKTIAAGYNPNKQGRYSPGLKPSVTMVDNTAADPDSDEYTLEEQVVNTGKSTQVPRFVVGDQTQTPAKTPRNKQQEAFAIAGVGLAAVALFLILRKE